MPERRSEGRPAWRERRAFRRPPLWLTLLLLIIAGVTFAYAKHQRNVIHEKTAILFRVNENSPSELNRIRNDLSQADLTKAELAKELDGRMKYMESLQGEEGDITIETNRSKLPLPMGKQVTREAELQAGE